MSGEFIAIANIIKHNRQNLNTLPFQGYELNDLQAEEILETLAKTDIKSTDSVERTIIFRSCGKFPDKHINALRTYFSQVTQE